MLRSFACGAVTSRVADRDLARARLLEARDHAQGRGLAAARRAEQRQQLARRDVEADIAHRRDVALHRDGGSAADTRSSRMPIRPRHPPSAPSRLLGGRRAEAAQQRADAGRNDQDDHDDEHREGGGGPERELGHVLEDAHGDQRPADRDQEDRRADRRHRADEHDAEAGEEGRQHQRQRDAAERGDAAARRGSCEASSRLLSIWCSSATVVRMPVGP